MDCELACWVVVLQAVRSTVQVITRVGKIDFMFNSAKRLNDVSRNLYNQRHPVLSVWESTRTFAANVGVTPVFGYTNRHESLFYT